MRVSEFLRAAVIGSGYWGRNLVRNFHALDALQTICDSNEQALQNFHAQYPAIEKTSSLATVLNNSSIQGIVIATPAVSQASLVRQALLIWRLVFSQALFGQMTDMTPLLTVACRQSLFVIEAAHQ